MTDDIPSLIERLRTASKCIPPPDNLIEFTF